MTTTLRATLILCAALLQPACAEDAKNAPDAAHDEFFCKSYNGWNKGYEFRLNLSTGEFIYHDLDSKTKHEGKIAAPGETKKYLRHLLEEIDENHLSIVGSDVPEWHMTLTVGEHATKRSLGYVPVWTAGEINNPDPKRRLEAKFAISQAPQFKENAYATLAISFVEHLLETHLPKKKTK